MGILALNHRTRVIAALMTLHCAVVCIHRAVDVAMIGRSGSAFILYGTGLVIILYQLVTGHEVLAVAILITH